MLALVAAVVWRQPVLFGRVLFVDLVAGVLQYTIKRLVGRARPPASISDPAPLVHVPSTPSFPSGHATAAFACAFVFARARPPLAWAFFLLAALIAFSRDYVGVHYPLDTIAGAALGTAIGLLVAGDLAGNVARQTARTLRLRVADRRRSLRSR